MGFGIDMAKAREIHKTKIRTAREPLLVALDIEFQKALETSSSTTDELKAQWNTSILGTSPYS